MPTLRLRTGKQEREYALTKEQFRIGRTSENDLEINSPLVSRRQSCIMKKEGRYILYDLESSNGTFVNNQRVEMHPLQDGDVIRVGDSEIHFAGEKAPAAPKLGGPLPGSLGATAANEIVQNVDEIAQSLSFDITGALSQGMSLRDVRAQAKQAQKAEPKEASHESDMFFVLYQVGKHLATTSTLDEVLLFSMKLVFEAINCERGAILLVDSETNGLSQKLNYTRKRGPIDGELGVSLTIANRVIKERVGVITSDALQDSRFNQGLSIVQFNIRSALCVPLWEGERTYGVIYLDNLAKAYAFKKDDLELLTAIANLIAIRLKQESLNEKLRQEEVARNHLAQYHSPDVVEYLLTHGGNVEVSEREVSVLFVDVVASTTLAERLGPTRVSEVLNRFFELGTGAIFDQKGQVNKFIGDAVMGIFNAPLDVADHRQRAVEASVQMLRGVRDHNEKNPGDAFQIRVGVNSGVAMAGDVGTARRKEYTVLGDPVNVAARLVGFREPMKIVIGEETYSAVRDRYEAKDLGEVMLKGKKKPTRAYELVV